MKTLFYLSILFLTPLVFSEVSSTLGDEDTFECKPSQKIKDRVNEHCIQASDIAIDYKSPIEYELTKAGKVIGKAFITSKTLENGSTYIEISHQCTGKPKSKKTPMTFCGYANSTLDRESPGTKEIREEIAKVNKLSEKTSQQKIDDLMAKEINPWIADPKKNIEAIDGVLKIQSLQEADGTTCYGLKVLTYETDCK
jgi:hypothetical protein